MIVISWCTNPGVTIREIILNGCRAAASATTDDAIQVVPLTVRLRQFITRSKVVHRPGCRKRRISTLSLGVNFLRPEHHLFLHSWRDNYSKLIVVWLTGPESESWPQIYVLSLQRLELRTNLSDLKILLTAGPGT